jgi:predicted enzyme related to lactoylglutathione lyase
MLKNATMYTALPAKDVQRAKQFYQQKLGFSPKREEAGNIFYEVGDAKFFLYESPSAGSNQATAACFQVDNVKSTVKELKAKGVDFEHYEDIPGVTRQGDIHIADDGYQCSWFKDSEDNIISVTQTA